MTYGTAEDAEDAEQLGMKAEGGRRKAADPVSILHFALCIFHFAFSLCVLGGESSRFAPSKRRTRGSLCRAHAIYSPWSPQIADDST